MSETFATFELRRTTC